LKKKSLEKKLKIYSSLALGLTSLGVEGQVVYTDVVPDITIESGNKYFLDLNNDNNPDFVIEAIHKTSNLYGYQIEVNGVGIYAEGQNEFLVDYFSTSNGDNSYWPKALGLNTQINNLQDLWINTSSGMAMNILFEFYFTTQTLTETFQAGHWQDAKNKFLGLKLKINGNSHYGWARLDVDSAGTKFTIKDYAFNSRPNSQILAGEKGSSSVNKTDAERLINLENRTLKISGLTDITEISIYNSIGKIVITENNISNYSELDFLALDSGYYIVVLSGNEQIYSEKIFLK
jgi:hypothetical protein